MWKEGLRRRQSQDSVSQLLETCWRMRGPGGRVVSCAMYRVPYGIELRVQFNDADVLRSQRYVAPGGADRNQSTPELHQRARADAEVWRELVLGRGGFDDLDRDTSGDCN